MSIIALFPAGWIGTKYDNEIEIVSTKPDTPKARLGVVYNLVESNLGSVSGNIVREDGNHEEFVELMMRLTANLKAGAFYIALRPEGSDRCREYFYIDPNAAIFRVPVRADLESQDGRFRLVVQNDGNLVFYEGDIPLWASNTVRPPAPPPAPTPAPATSRWSRLAFWR